MSRLTKSERAAVRSALAAWLAGEHDDDELDGFTWDDMESALGKVQEDGAGGAAPDQCVARGPRGGRCRRDATALFIRGAIAGYPRTSFVMCDPHAREFFVAWRMSIEPVNERARTLLKDVA